jgi:hypothetical protein
MIRLSVWAAIVVATVCALAGCSTGKQANWLSPSGVVSTTTALTSSTAIASTFTMKGAYIMFLSSAGTLKNGDVCRGDGTYDDIRNGATVKVFDTAGKLLASGSLDVGKFVSNKLGMVCTFPLSVEGVPDGPSQYGVEVVNHGVEPIPSDEAHTWVAITVGP